MNGYYNLYGVGGNDLEAVRCGRWKLFARRWSGAERKSVEVRELYDLENDVGETTNVYGEHPEVVAELYALLEGCKEDLGCQASGVTGRNCRPAGHVDDARPLTEYDPAHPYIVAMYDLEEAG